MAPAEVDGLDRQQSRSALTRSATRAVGVAASSRTVTGPINRSIGAVVDSLQAAAPSAPARPTNAALPPAPPDVSTNPTASLPRSSGAHTDASHGNLRTGSIAAGQSQALRAGNPQQNACARPQRTPHEVLNGRVGSKNKSR